MQGFSTPGGHLARDMHALIAAAKSGKAEVATFLKSIGAKW
jgi:hypothetical protein